ncbi:hypothetical protein [Desulfosporosinus hippei]|uniref:Uncharacterized protein n=1 Tax=Desulfosporosinus hippei DSM 8344 TaxID=1121419 RepID=A0A1G7Z8U1_9FIRM|nr:hypothetical protein [Desulfosporosinus hippei]SDH05182.1 hypothetical protein SAMN05443529_10944 [Desulfosporosinus hippei DSM 8344]
MQTRIFVEIKDNLPHSKGSWVGMLGSQVTVDVNFNRLLTEMANLVIIKMKLRE